VIVLLAVELSLTWGSPMILYLLQIAAVLAIALYLLRWRASVRRRNAQTWDSLLARLSPEWSARELSEQFLWKEGLTATPEDAWKRMHGPKGLWIMYKTPGSCWRWRILPPAANPRWIAY